MTRLSLVRASDDGEHLIVATDDGTQFELPLNDELRRTVAFTRARPTATGDSSTRATSSMTPKEIQQRIRGGLNARELAELTGDPVEALERYEAPVIAERAYIADLAKTTRIGRENGAPVLADLVTDRLASRGVDPEEVVWDAWREIDEPWMVAVDFPVEGRTVRALWSFDHTARAVTAQDEESRWLTETELLDVPIPRRHLKAVRSDDEVPLDQSRPAMPASGNPDATPDASAPSATELLLEDLTVRRGTRETVDAEDLEAHDDDGGFEGFGPAQRKREAEVGFDRSRTSGKSMPHPAGSALDEKSAGSPRRKSEPKSTRKGRAAMPSWDEIVFGAKND